MVRQLRQCENHHNGLILANGGVLTYQHALCLTNHPRRDGSPYPMKNPLPDQLEDVRVPAIAIAAEGEAIIEVFPPHSFLLPTLHIKSSSPLHTSAFNSVINSKHAILYTPRTKKFDRHTLYPIPAPTSQKPAG